MARKVSQLSIDSAENPERWHAHNYMMFLLLNPRLNFVDLATFDKHQVFNTKYKNGKLTMATVNFESSRNGLNIRSDLNVVSIEILNKYDIVSKKGQDLIFPIGFENTQAGRIKHNDKREKYALEFNEIAKLADIKMKFKLSAIRENWYIATDPILSDR
ncbi:MAG: hypothetical protein HRT72_02275 [Flavobacteriales bacterium]|nr:hypothetical protein [Flavobacteriales bacterium]